MSEDRDALTHVDVARTFDEHSDPRAMLAFIRLIIPALAVSPEPPPTAFKIREHLAAAFARGFNLGSSGIVLGYACAAEEPHQDRSVKALAVSGEGKPPQREECMCGALNPTSARFGLGHLAWCGWTPDAPKEAR